ARFGDLSRSAVIGKLNRLGLVGKSTPKRSRKAGQSTRGARRKAPGDLKLAVKLGRAYANGANSLAEALLQFKSEPKKVVGPAWEALPGTTPISLLMATDETCRWPIGDPLEPDFGYCGCAASEGSVYCAAHRVRGTTTFRATAEDKRKLDRSDLSRRIFA
uniref:GcrA family cell cycle regulator n=1 Tax=Devosia sp. TaxID=1871048 RepID=UPI002FC7877B